VERRKQADSHLCPIGEEDGKKFRKKPASRGAKKKRGERTQRGENKLVAVISARSLRGKVKVTEGGRKGGVLA